MHEKFARYIEFCIMSGTYNIKYGGQYLGRSVEPGSNMAASTTAIRDRGISVTTWGARHHGNTAAEHIR